MHAAAGQVGNLAHASSLKSRRRTPERGSGGFASPLVPAGHYPVASHEARRHETMIEAYSAATGQFPDSCLRRGRGKQRNAAGLDDMTDACRLAIFTTIGETVRSRLG